MKFAKLMDDKGRQIKEPTAVEGSVSWTAAEGVAHAWAADGKTLLAEMTGARVVWMGAAGVRLEGLEPIDLGGTRFRAQAWQLIF
jgi:hypothetical protein